MISVLIVEDDPMVAKINSKYVSMVTGFRLSGIASDGKLALEFLQHEKVDLILLDVFMPHLGGLELLKIIRNDFPGVDVIMVTAAKSSQDIQTMLHHGVIDCILKPFEFDRFQTALLTYQERYRLLHSTQELEQCLLDKEIFKRVQITVNHQSLPKGIDGNTFLVIKKAIKQHGKEFTINDLAAITGLSRISLKKYFDYMVDIGELHYSLYYPAIGRPSKLYHGEPKN